MVKGKVHMERKRSGDILTIFLQLDDQTYYFFQYSRNIPLCLQQRSAVQHHAQRGQGR
jgi:hypothetical protein